jgi:hypothetical protein
MELRRRLFPRVIVVVAVVTLSVTSPAQTASTSSSNSAKPAKKSAAPIDPGSDAGTVTSGLYHNQSFALSCKIPSGWVLRTDEMNDRGENDRGGEEEGKNKPDSAQLPASTASSGRVLLAAFSRPPEARGEDVNSSILIAAESIASYPGLKDAAQYFGPLSEVAKAQGFTEDEEPYESAVGGKTLVRADFHKDIGSRVMHQSTLARLAHGYAISITLIAGTEDEIEELIDGLTFSSTGK